MDLLLQVSEKKHSSLPQEIVSTQDIFLSQRLTYLDTSLHRKQIGYATVLVTYHGSLLRFNLI